MYNDWSFKTFSLRTSTMMDTCARLLCCSFLLGYLSVAYAAFASFRPYRLPKPGARAIISLGIRLPPTRSSILTSDFDNKVVGDTWYGLVWGQSPSSNTPVFFGNSSSSPQLTFSRTLDNQATARLSILENDTCSVESNDFDPVSNIVRSRAEFSNTDVSWEYIAKLLAAWLYHRGSKRQHQMTKTTGHYFTIFSSDLDSYIWWYQCTDRIALNRCSIQATLIGLYTRTNPPQNLDFEQIGKELKDATSLTMEGVPGKYEFLFAQGEDNGC